MESNEEYQREIETISTYGISKEKLLKVGYEYEQLVEIRLGLEHKIDVSKYLSKEYAWFQMTEIRRFLELGLDIDSYMHQGYKWVQLTQIRKGIESGIDINQYTNKMLNASQMREIRLGIISSVNISLYADVHYDWYQMEEIRLGLENRIDVSLYLNPDLPYYVMREIREGLQNGIDLTPFVGMNHRLMRQMRKAMLIGVNITKYINLGYDDGQIEQIRKALQNKVDIEEYLNINYTKDCLREIRLGLENQIDVAPYATLDFNWQQMKEIRKGIKEGIDVKWYAKPLCLASQMQEIRLGLMAGLNVKSYSSLMYSALDMKRKREKLLLNDPSESSIIELNKEILSEGIMITSSLDRKNAYLELAPRVDQSKYTLDEVIDVLREHGIKEGINIYTIDELIQKRQYNVKKLIAQSTEPVDGNDGYYEYFFDLDMPKLPKPLEDGTIDYKKVILFDQVEEGQKLAYYHKAKSGINGVNVFGEVLLSKKGREKSVIKGKGFVLDNDMKTYYSLVRGKVEISDINKDDIYININNLCIVPEVTRTTGDLFFEGSINVNGNVGSGVIIESGEDIVVEGNVEGAILKAGKNVIIKKGMVGNKEGKIIAKGSVYGKFFEQTNIKSGDEVKANYFLNCEIETDNTVVVTGKKGAIIGGKIIAKRGVEAGNIGNEANIPTYIEIGENESFKETYIIKAKHLESIKEEIKVFKRNKKKLEEAVQTKSLANLEVYKNILQVLEIKEKALINLESEVEQLKYRIELSKVSKISVTGSVFPKTTVKIENNKLNINEKLNKVIIKKKDGIVETFANRG